MTEEKLQEMDHYNRFAITDSGVSPRAIPGLSDKLVLVDSDEHDQYGRITEDLDIRQKLVDTRLRKYARCTTSGATWISPTVP